jgi:hypothetical protein
MTPAHQEILKASLEKTAEAFFRKRASKLVLPAGAAPAKFDATGLLVVLSAWVGELIKHAPEEMKDALFMSFADSAATIAGIKAEDEQDQETLQ